MKSNRFTTTNYITCKTNRQFYVRRKKQPEDRSDTNIKRVLQTLITRDISNTSVKMKREHLLTEKREDSKISDKFFEIAEAKRNLDRIIKKLHPFWSRLIKCFEKTLQSQSSQFLENNKIEFYEAALAVAEIEIEKYRVDSNNMVHSMKENKMVENAVMLENIRLQKENILLRKQLNLNQTGEIVKQIFSADLSKFNESNSIDANDVTKYVTLERKYHLRSQQIEIMKRETQALKEDLFLLRQEKKSLQERITEMKIKNENLCSEIINLQLKHKKTGNSDDQKQCIMMMQVEEIQSYAGEVFELRKLYLNLNKKYKSLLIKFKKTKTDNNCKMGILFNRQSEFFPQQIEAFQQIRNKSQRILKLNVEANGNWNRKSDKNFLYQQYLGGKQTFNNKEAIKKAPRFHQQYFHPTFFYLISEELNFFGIDQNNYEHFNQNIRLNFLATVRAIMDSKYNEFVATNNFEQISSFPSFVLAWLNTFQINSEKKVVQMESDMSSPQSICSFYANLMSEKLNFSWEIICFRQFLLESLGNDELYFYLQVRFYLLGGDICQNLDYAFEEVYHIEYDKGIQALNKYVKEKDVEYRKILEQFFKRSTIYIRKRNYLDLHFVLRMLLEYYQSIKQQEIEEFIKTLAIITQGKKINLNLTDFIKFFSYHFCDLSLTKKIELYRRCYCVGNGNVSFQIFVTVLNQENVFLSWVESTILNSKIKIQQNQEPESENFIIVPDFDWLYSVERNFRFIYNSQLVREISRLGLEMLVSNLNRSYHLNSETIHERLEHCFQVCMLISKKMYKSGIVNEEGLSGVITLTSEFMLQLSKITLRKNQINELMRDFKYSAACSKIIRFYQKKKAEMTRSILYAYSSNVMKEEENDRNCTLRTEFLNIIENMKSKKKFDSIKIIEE